MTTKAPDPTSRRTFLKVSIAAPLCGIALAGCATIGVPRVSKAFAGYEERSKDRNRCQNCVHFMKPNGCTIVEGAINPRGECNYFLMKT